MRKLFSQLFNFALGKRITGKREVQIGAANATRVSATQDYRSGSTRGKITLIVTIAMVAAFLLSIVALITYTFVYVDRQSPRIFTDIIIGSIGYFAGIISMFFRHSSS